MREIFYIGGLPRSGSTLLCNIFAQNTDLFVSKSTSGCSEIIFNIKNIWPNLIEHKAAEKIDQEQLRRVLHASLHSYHNTDKKLILDKSRNWPFLFETLEFINQKKPKLIIPVRNLTQVIASFEKLWRKTSGEQNWPMFAPYGVDEWQTVEGRCKIYCKSDAPVGIAYNRVKDLIDRGHKKDVLFLEFELLTRYPEQSMKMVYDYLELPYYQHNFEHVEQYTKENDAEIHGIRGLHDIKNKVEPLKDYSLEILGNELYDQYSNAEVWRE